MPPVHQPPVILAIAGSDTSAGAGTQADTKTASACGAYALSAITAITAQDPAGVQACWPVTPAQLRSQIDAALAWQPAAIKIGMLGNADLVHTVADALGTVPSIPLVLDTIIRASSGAALLDEPGIAILRDKLLPLATIITPNRQEARWLFGNDHETDLQHWAREHGVAILLTGGDSHPATAGSARFCTDVFITATDIEHLTLPRIETDNDHGTGCTLTTAIASFLAHGFPLAEAVQLARRFVHQALLGAQHHTWPGRGSPNHFFAFGQQASLEEPA